jgi:porphobilinogen deaminase
MGLEHRISQILDETILYHAVGQGALALECRVEDETTKRLVSVLEHRETRVCIEAERSFLGYLEGGCSIPLGVISHYDEETHSLQLKGCIYSLDGQHHVSHMLTIHKLPGLYHDPDYLQSLQSAQQLGIDLACLLIENQNSTLLLRDIRLHSIPPSFSS